MSITVADLKPNILGYYYVNASNADKTVNVWFQFTETEAYYIQFIFPKCKVSYVTFYYNQSQNLVFDFQCDDNLQDAIEKTTPFINNTPASRRGMILVIVEDPERRSIQFITEDENDKTYNEILFDPNCKLTDSGKLFNKTIRQAILDGDAGTELLNIAVDGPTSLKKKSQAKGISPYGGTAGVGTGISSPGVSGNVAKQMLDSLIPGPASDFSAILFNLYAGQGT
jgi:hypothetical protein